MAPMRNPEPVHIGLVSDEPIRVEGLKSIFDQPAKDGAAPLIPLAGTLREMLALPSLEYLVVDMHAVQGGVQILDSIRHERPSLKLIVIGPEGNDELVMESIIAGARAYLDLTADTAIVRQAIEVVTSGSIWAPRRLLSKLIDRLLKVPDSSLTGALHLTAREIARHLGIEERTVKSHVHRLMRKTGADNRIELTMRAMNLPLTPRTHPRARPAPTGRSPGPGNAGRPITNQ